MSHRFVRCPHCKMPHDAAERVCPTTGRRMPVEPAGASARSRMSELPPPERRPEPLGFDPAKHRINEPPPRGQESGSTSLPITRSVSQDLVGRTVSDRYLVRGILGEGGMGMVYEAEHIGLGRQVAIKVLNPAQAKKRVAVKRFQQEARAAGAIGHPNICEVYDLGLLDDGSPYLVMEKLIGTTLSDRISREGGLPFDEIADVMAQVLAGLIAAHDKGIVHRDIKPENIFLARRVGSPPIVKILDFGVSKMMPQFHGGDEQLDLTRTGMVMGTPYYMSPEQARGERNLDGRVDVYACGVMMYESIVGRRPFLAPNYNALLLAIINTTPKPLQEARAATPPAVSAIVARMMAKARDDRYPTAYAALRDIQAFALVLQQQPVRSARRAPEEDPRRRAAGATLRSRMADPDARPRPPPVSIPSMSTRPEPKRGEIQRPPAMRSDSGSYDIPVDVTGSELSPVRQPGEHVDEMPTEVFRPGKHVMPEPRAAQQRPPQPHAQPQPPAHAQPQRFPQPRPAAGVPAGGPPPVPPVPVPSPSRRGSLAPVDISGLSGDDWDNETGVQRPSALTTMKHRDKPGPRQGPPQEPRHQQSPQPQPSHGLVRPFNPDETVNMQGDLGIDVEMDFDETSRSPPPPRRSR